MTLVVLIETSPPATHVMKVSNKAETRQVKRGMKASQQVDRGETPDRPYQKDSHGRTAKADQPQDLFRRFSCVPHGPAHGTRKSRESEAFEREHQGKRQHEIAHRAKARPSCPTPPKTTLIRSPAGCLMKNPDRSTFSLGIFFTRTDFHFA